MPAGTQLHRLTLTATTHMVLQADHALLIGKRDGYCRRDTIKVDSRTVGFQRRRRKISDIADVWFTILVGVTLAIRIRIKIWVEATAPS